MQQPFHLKGLNGLRAIAAIAVVISHTLLAGPEFGLPARGKGLDLAGFGVTIFFALSGFLITYLLLLEREKFDTISIRAFYIRRVLRIWPLYYLYLLLSIVVLIVFQLASLPGPLGFYIFLSANIPFIAGTALPFITHYWSLGVEEQFYLVWPWVVSRTNNIVRVLTIFIAAFIAAKLAMRAYMSYSGIAWPYIAFEVCRFECMAIGALGATFSFQHRAWFRQVVFHPVAQVVAWGVIVLLFFGKFHIASVIDSDIVAVITVILIMNVSFNEKRMLGLDQPIFNFLGKISYGIYVYHPLIIFFAAKALRNLVVGIGVVPGMILAFAAVLGLTITVAWVSYEWYEKKFLRRKEKFAAIPSSSVSVSPGMN